MPTASAVVSHLDIRINGEEFPATVLPSLLGVVIDQHAHLPGMFTLRLSDPGLKILDEGPFRFQTKVAITATDKNNRPVKLITGEVTALEPEFNEGMDAELVVRGYDLTHRLYRKTRSTTYLNVKDSDLAHQFAQTAELDAKVEATQTVYDHLYQHNQSDLAFLMQRAWRIGYECFVEDDALIFRKPKLDQPQLTLTWGDDLLSFRPRISIAEQVEEVLVKGWDVQKKSAIIGRAAEGALYPTIGDDQRTEAQKNGKLTLVDQPVVSQAEAEILAKARLNELSGSYIEAEGEAFRRPDIRAGQVVKLEALGQRLSGAYLLTHVTHVHTATGFKTTFGVRGLRTGLLLAQWTNQSTLDRWPGVFPAIVTNTDDPKGWGRVKVKFPWLSNEDESDWARVSSAGAGPKAGFCLTPAVEDEVLVAFIYGDFSQPIIVGGVWNGKDGVPPPPANAASGEKPLVRTWHSRTGHHITMSDNADKRIDVKTAGGHTLTLDDAKQCISVRSAGGLEIILNDNGKEISIQSGGKITVKGSTEVQVESGGNLQIKANGMLQVEAGANLELKANGSATLQGAARVAVQAPQISLG
jgi:phage protein D